MGRRELASVKCQRHSLELALCLPSSLMLLHIFLLLATLNYLESETKYNFMKIKHSRLRILHESLGIMHSYTRGIQWPRLAIGDLITGQVIFRFIYKSITTN